MKNFSKRQESISGFHGGLEGMTPSEISFYNDFLVSEIQSSIASTQFSMDTPGYGALLAELARICPAQDDVDR